VAGLTARGKADAEAFLSRLTRLDPAALVRLRAGAGGGPPGEAAPHWLALWARLPWEVLVTRRVAASQPPAEDITVSARALLSSLAGGEPPARRDIEWRWRLPPSAGEVVERIPSDEIRRIGAAAARTLRDAGESGVGGRPVGERALRDALLDHVPIVVQTGGRWVEVSQRLVQAVLRMGFLVTGAGRTAEPPVAVRVAAGWVGLAAGYGTAWRQSEIPFTVRTFR
jgi:hypothetical protein